jgi:hypothetical protein
MQMCCAALAGWTAAIARSMATAAAVMEQRVTATHSRQMASCRCGQYLCLADVE